MKMAPQFDYARGARWAAGQVLAYVRDGSEIEQFKAAHGRLKQQSASRVASPFRRGALAALDAVANEITAETWPWVGYGLEGALPEMDAVQASIASGAVVAGTAADGLEKLGIDPATATTAELADAVLLLLSSWVRDDVEEGERGAIYELDWYERSRRGRLIEDAGVYSRAQGLGIFGWDAFDVLLKRHCDLGGGVDQQRIHPTLVAELDAAGVACGCGFGTRLPVTPRRSADQPTPSDSVPAVRRPSRSVAPSRSVPAMRPGRQFWKPPVHAPGPSPQDEVPGQDDSGADPPTEALRTESPPTESPPCEGSVDSQSDLFEGLAPEVKRKLAGCFVDAGEYVATSPPPIDPVVEGLFERGDKVMLLASAKMKKTFFLIQACVCLAVGEDFMGLHIPKRRRVLLVNLEVKPSHIHRRVQNMAVSLGVHAEDLRGRLFVLNCRGLGLSWREVIDVIRGFASGLIDVVVFDPFYKLVEGDENKAADVKPLLDAFDQLAEQTGVAVLHSHHDAKGTPGDRDTRDRGAGSNVSNRDTDCTITLTRHQTDEQATVVAFLPRNFREPAPVVVRFEDGRFVQANDLAPDVASSRSRTAQQAPRGDEWRAHLADAVDLACSKVWRRSAFEREVSTRYRLSEKQTAMLVKAVRDDPSVFSDRGPNRGNVPTYLMGQESDVRAEIERLKLGETDQRQPCI